MGGHRDAMISSVCGRAHTVLSTHAEAKSSPDQGRQLEVFLRPFLCVFLLPMLAGLSPPAPVCLVFFPHAAHPAYNVISHTTIDNPSESNYNPLGPQYDSNHSNVQLFNVGLEK